MRDPVRTAYLYGMLLSSTPVCGAAAGVAASAGDIDGHIWWPISQLWGRTLTRAAGVTDILTEGIERAAAPGSRILMANHESHLDVTALIAAIDRPVSFLAKAELFRYPVFGWALSRTGHIAVDRGKRDKAFASIDRAAREVRSGKCVLVFPEGTRSRDGRLRRFKKGGFVLAVRSGVPIVPIGVAGTREVLPPGPWVTGEGPIAIVVGHPIETIHYTTDTKDVLMAHVREEIATLRVRAQELVGSAR